MLYVMEINTDTPITGSELDELEQVVVDFLTPETVTRVSIELVEDE